jgi:(5-formylfuran-3-yl)methyl phosphate synthase
LAKLLVSVRSQDEARAAVAGGADVIDVKEPLLGSLGRANVSTWRDVLQVVPETIPVSVALGELNEWAGPPIRMLPHPIWPRIAYCKLGLSTAGADWRERWRALRQRFSALPPAGPAWVAVIYADWERAKSPEPHSVIDAAIEIDECRGVLIDTWDKSCGTIINRTWKPSIDRIQQAGRFVALAGALDRDAILRLKMLHPDLFAVRGAACENGNRLMRIDPARVALLARAAHAGP